MINYLTKSLEFDIAYMVNSFLYVLRGLPILKDLLTDDIYKSGILKKIANIVIIVFFILRSLFLKFFYFFIIFVGCYELFPNTFIKRILTWYEE